MIESLLATSVDAHAFLLMALCVLYVFPAFVAFGRGHANATPILVVNLGLGWTLVGWIAALAWAFTAQKSE